MITAQSFEVYSTIDEIIAHNSFWAVVVSSVILVVLALISLQMKKMPETVKQLLFWGITGVTVLCTLYLSTATIYLNTISSSKGPVHWHADVEIWECGTEQNLKDPKGLSNKIGSPTLHEHNDKRIHLEGVVVEARNASLGNFFHVIDGDITADSVTFPTNEGPKTLKTGDVCGGQPAQLQAFVYKSRDGVYHQEKIANPTEYIISPYGQVPEGDCVIIELDQPKASTEKMCRSFKVAEQIGKIKKGAQ